MFLCSVWSVNYPHIAELISYTLKFTNKNVHSHLFVYIKRDIHFETWKRDAYLISLPAGFIFFSYESD